MALIQIGVHNGFFHPDDISAVGVLHLMHTMKDDRIKVIRTRDPSILKDMHYTVDVGKEYDHGNRQYDHHQDVAPIRSNGVPYAAFGLVWKHYGHEVLQLLGHSADIFHVVDRELVQEVDARDNGVSLPVNSPFITVFGKYNPVHGESVDEHAQFRRATRDFTKVFMGALDAYSLYPENGFAAALTHQMHSHPPLVQRLEKVKILEAAAKKLLIEELDRQDGRVAYISSQALPWREVIQDYPNFDFVSFKGSNGTYYAQSCPTVRDGLEPKILFPEAWAGLEYKELDKVTHQSGGVFCHKARFIIGAETEECLKRLIDLAFLQDVSTSQNDI